MTDRKESPSLEAGRELMHELASRIQEVEMESAEPMLFYAGLFGGMAGHMAAAIGKDAAMAILEFIKPLVEAVAAKHEGPTQ